MKVKGQCLLPLSLPSPLSSFSPCVPVCLLFTLEGAPPLFAPLLLIMYRLLYGIIKIIYSLYICSFFRFLFFLLSSLFHHLLSLNLNQEQPWGWCVCGLYLHFYSSLLIGRLDRSIVVFVSLCLCVCFLISSLTAAADGLLDF